MDYIYTFEDGTVIKSNKTLSVIDLITLVEQHGNMKLVIVKEEDNA